MRADVARKSKTVFIQGGRRKEGRKEGRRATFRSLMSFRVRYVRGGRKKVLNKKKSPVVDCHFPRFISNNFAFFWVGG